MSELAFHSVFICEMCCGKNITCSASWYLPAESGASPEKEVSTVNSLSARLARPAKKSRSAGSWPQTRSDFSGKCSESVHDKEHSTANPINLSPFTEFHQLVFFLLPVVPFQNVGFQNIETRRPKHKLGPLSCTCCKGDTGGSKPQKWMEMGGLLPEVPLEKTQPLNSPSAAMEHRTSPQLGTSMPSARTDVATTMDTAPSCHKFFEQQLSIWTLTFNHPWITSGPHDENEQNWPRLAFANWHFDESSSHLK